MIKIALRPFPGSVEDCINKRESKQRVCAVHDCKAQVLFEDVKNGKWVCYEHGWIVLLKQWDCDHTRLDIVGDLSGRIIALEAFVAAYDAVDADGPYHNDCGILWCLEEGCRCLGANATTETYFEHPCSCGLDALGAAREALK